MQKRLMWVGLLQLAEHTPCHLLLAVIASLRFVKLVEIKHPLFFNAFSLILVTLYIDYFNLFTIEGLRAKVSLPHIRYHRS